MNAKMKEAQGKSGDKLQDAIAMLTADHKKVKGLFDDFEKMKSEEDASEDKAALVMQICQELTVHAQLEEEIFYPAVRDAIEDADLMDEAEVEHACAKELIAQLEEMDPDEELYDAKVTVLGEQIVHHVKEEEGDMFVKAKKSELDMESLGEQMANRKSELLAAMDSPSDEESEASDNNAPSSKNRTSKPTSSKR